MGGASKRSDAICVRGERPSGAETGDPPQLVDGGLSGYMEATGKRPPSAASAYLRPAWDRPVGSSPPRDTRSPRHCPQREPWAQGRRPGTPARESTHPARPTLSPRSPATRCHPTPGPSTTAIVV